MWLFVPRVGLLRASRRTDYTGRSIYLPFGKLLSFPPPVSPRSTSAPTKKGSRRAARQRSPSGQSLKMLPDNKAVIFSYFRQSTRMLIYFVARAKVADAESIFYFLDVAAVARDTRQIWQVQGASRLAPIWRWCSFNDKSLSPFSPLRVGNIFPDRKIEALDIHRLRLRLSCLFHLLYTYLPIAASVAYFQMHDERAFIIITSARITQSDRSPYISHPDPHVDPTVINRWCNKNARRLYGC